MNSSSTSLPNFPSTSSSDSDTQPPKCVHCSQPVNSFAYFFSAVVNNDEEIYTCYCEEDKKLTLAQLFRHAVYHDLTKKTSPSMYYQGPPSKIPRPAPTSLPLRYNQTASRIPTAANNLPKLSPLQPKQLSLMDYILQTYSAHSSQSRHRRKPSKTVITLSSSDSD